MFKHTVTYKDFNNDQHIEDLYFHMSTPDMLDLQFNPEVDGDLDEFIKHGIRSGEGRKLWIIFKLLIVNSYGRRSADGAKFIKKPEYTEDFINSPAFEKFFEWLLLDSPDGKHGKEFYNAIMPERLKAEVAEIEKSNPEKKKLKDLSREELEKMYLEKLQGNKIIEGTTTSNE